MLRAGLGSGMLFLALSVTVVELVGPVSGW